MNHEDLAPVFKNGPKVLDEKGREIGRGLREKTLLTELGFTIGELRRLGKDGTLIRMLVRPPAAPGSKLQPLVAVYVLGAPPRASGVAPEGDPA